MLRYLITLFTLFLFISVANAEVYKWEDANGMHYTDSPGSVPEKYREKVYAETREQIRNSSPQVSTGITQQNIPMANQINQSAVYQANLEQQRRVTEAMRQQQARALAVTTKNVESAFTSLAGFMLLWIIIGIIVFIAWISTIVDIVRSEFETPSNKTVWMLLVILLPMFGMLLYYIFGLSQKCNTMTYCDKYRDDLHTRLRPKSPNDRDFII